MDIEKAGRIRSYVQAQLAFVPFYETDLLDRGGSQSEAFGLQSPLLTARNPLVTCQPEFNPSSSSSGSAETGSMLTEKPAANYKTRLAKRCPAAAEQDKHLLTLETRSRSASDPDFSSKPMKDLPPTKKERRRRNDKPRLPSSLSFLYGFVPKNVGPSRLTVSGSKPI